MRSLKTLIALVTLTAVAAQPALAALRPCCCVKKVEIETSRACCAAKHEAASHEASSHWAVSKRAVSKRAVHGELPQATGPARSCCALNSTIVVVHATSCCCEKAQPAAPAPRDPARTTAEQTPLVPAVAVVDLFDGDPAARHAAIDFVLRPLSGPSLLARYCIWRK